MTLKICWTEKAANYIPFELNEIYRGYMYISGAVFSTWVYALGNGIKNMENRETFHFLLIILCFTSSMSYYKEGAGNSVDLKNYKYDGFPYKKK